MKAAHTAVSVYVDCILRNWRDLNYKVIVYIQGETQKFQDNCYKTQITSYMDMIYFYSSKYLYILCPS